MQLRQSWASLLLLIACSAAGQQTNDALKQGFASPSGQALPRVWWHWMSGNVSQPGITADLEWMHRVGIGGFQMFDGDLGIGQYVQHPVIWMTPEWKAAFLHAGQEADRLHLEMSMAASGGWSETAGPWVKPSEAMKKAVWSEAHLQGGRHIRLALPHPPENNGPYQGLGIIDLPNIPMVGGAPALAPATPPIPVQDPQLYKDTLVLAFPQPPSDKSPEQPAKITSSDSAFDAQAATDGDYRTTAKLHFKPGNDEAWVQWAFAEPQPIRSFVIQMAPAPTRQAPPLPTGELASSEDGTHWSHIASLPGTPPYIPLVGSRTFAFAPVKARYFRVTVHRVAFDLDAKLRGNVAPDYAEFVNLQLSSRLRVNFAEDKAGYGIYIDQPHSVTPAASQTDAIDPAKVIDVTTHMQPDGTLDWDAPPGDWTIIRMGYSLTGKKNHPATPAATGFEVDKLSATHVRTYMQTYTSMISGTLGSEYGKSFRNFLMDSWEAGRQNWTEDMLPEFRRRRGYDATPWLPVLTGTVVGSSAQSDAFLWDYRRTIAEMLAENHYKLAAGFLKSQGLGLYSEAMGVTLPTVGDGLLNKGQVDVPMGEFWTPRPGFADMPTRATDVIETASAAHIYGKPIAAAESFTSMPSTPGWAQSPFYLKGLADQNFARGINQIVFHTSDHQPFVDDDHKPGITLGYFGQHYSRNITWAEQAAAWNSYLARCSFLLQQGKPANDIAIFYGEGAPVTVPWWKDLVANMPAGYNFDYLNSDILLHQTSAADGHIQLQAGPQYRVLVIPDEFTSLTLEALRKIHELLQAGAVVLAPRTKASPSLGDQPRIAEFNSLAQSLWGSNAAQGSRTVGKGRLYWGISLKEVLAAEHIQPDITFKTPVIESSYAYPLPDTKAEELVWIHRAAAPADIYFIANQTARSEDTEVSFRVDGKLPELWHADTGTTESIAYRAEAGRTTINLHLDPLGSAFVVFREAGPSSRTLKPATFETLMTLPEHWQISFPPALGAPAQVSTDHLVSWTDFPENGIRYFSGSATYTQAFDLKPDQIAMGKLFLDLGRVREIAEVTINGRAIPQILWKPPFLTEVTSYLQPGANRLQVRVTNLWPNRLIGDQQPQAKKYTFSVYGAYQADSPLMESGLLGPVKLLHQR